MVLVASSGSLPRLGLGMAALGRPGYINLDRTSILGTERTIDTMQSQANLVMDQLMSLSKDSSTIPWLDCARSYGLSEKFVGEYLRSNKIAPDAVHVSSKWGYTYVAEWNIELDDGKPHEVKDHSMELEQTADCLGEYIDLYQVHSATFDSGILTNTDAHEAMAECRRNRGWKLGLSVSGPQQNDVIAKAMTVTVANGEALFDSVQCTFNVLEQRPAAALMEAKNSGMDIIIKEGLANGRALRDASPVSEYAKQLDCPPDALALGCILAQPFAPRVLSGAVTAEQLASNFEAYGVVEKLQENDSALLKEIMASTVVSSEEYWDERSALKWN